MHHFLKIAFNLLNVIKIANRPWASEEIIFDLSMIIRGKVEKIYWLGYIESKSRVAYLASHYLPYVNIREGRMLNERIMSGARLAFCMPQPYYKLRQFFLYKL